MCEAVEGKGVECGWGDGAVRWTGVNVCVCMCLCCGSESYVKCAESFFYVLSHRNFSDSASR